MYFDSPHTHTCLFVQESFNYFEAVYVTCKYVDYMSNTNMFILSHVQMCLFVQESFKYFEKVYVTCCYVVISYIQICLFVQESFKYFEDKEANSPENKAAADSKAAADKAAPKEVRYIRFSACTHMICFSACT
jgi:hypothetical protein